jgi:CheY-like chemotaxis protein/anti-sigma regulatory factor (Ser/Thr protein kinase)
MRTILVVDDEPIDKENVSRCLRAVENTHLIFADNGREALKKIRQDCPDLLLTDLWMPEVNGLELVEILQEEMPLLPIILMTSRGSEQIAVRALKAGADSYVPKKALRLELAETLKQVLELAESARKEHELLTYIRTSETTIELINDPSLLGPFANYFLENLRRIGFATESTRTQIGIALMEAASNALIHGNLELDSELRRKDRQEFDRQIQLRCGQEPFASRRIHCVAKESAEKVEYTIRDEGPGFNPTSLPDPTEPENLLEISGRGVMLIQTFMDTVLFNEKGNQITMIKHGT